MIPHPTSPLPFQAWIKPEKVWYKAGEKNNSLSLSFSRQAFPSPFPGHFHFYFDEQYYPLRTGSKSDQTGNKAIGNLRQGSLWPPHFVLLTLTTCISGGMKTSAAAQEHREACADQPSTWQLAEGLVCWSLTQYPLVKHLATVILYKVLFWKQKWRYVTTPNWNPEATSPSQGFLLRVPWSAFPLQSQTGA